MNPALIELLRCPETGQRLAQAPEELVRSLENRRRDGTLNVPASESQLNFAEPVEDALLREDRAVCYLVQRGVPLLLTGHGVNV
ncbi:MAG: hypothetical protein WCP06_08115 [Verrucomicrobiota bacterium]